MQYRTDLALEMITDEKCSGIEHSSKLSGLFKIDEIRIFNDKGAESTGKPKGNYVTFSAKSISDSMICDYESINLFADKIRDMLPENGTVLVAGLGNSSITPDAIGPMTVKGVLATRHLKAEFERIEGLTELRSTAVIAPGVLGQTGIEVLDIIRALCESIKPAAVIAVDALASRSLSRLGCTIQLCDTGISPGAGVGNNRPGINMKTLNLPVIAIGVPTVVDAEIIAERNNEDERSEAKRMIVTPREIDLIISRASKFIALSINKALHPDYDPEDLYNAV